MFVNELNLERAVRLELTIPDLQSGALTAWRRAQIGPEGEIRTLESSLEDSHVSSYITSADHFQLPITDCNCDLLLMILYLVLCLEIGREVRPQSKIGNWQSAICWNSWKDSNLQPRRSKRRSLPVELQERKHCRFPIANCQFDSVLSSS